MRDRITFIHQKAKQLSAQYLRLEAELLEIIQQVENLRVYHHLGYPSLFQYVIQELRLSEATTSKSRKQKPLD